MKKPLHAILLCFIAVILSGCPGDDLAYKGSYIDLNAVATNSMLGIYSVDDNMIIVVEEDSFGRRMFIYYGNTIASSYSVYGVKSYIYAILISQKTEGDLTYFYPDYNYIIYQDNINRKYKPNNEELIGLVNDTAIAGDIEWLKQKNDWEKPIDDSKCIRINMSRKNRAQESRTPLVHQEAQQKAYEHVAAPKDKYRQGLFYYLTSDQYDRHIYFFRCSQENYDYTGAYVVMFNKDGSFDPAFGILEITDIWHYQDELKAFKDRNGWNNPVDNDS